MSDTTSSAFESQPLLMLLEGYVLACIGRLSPEQNERMEQIVSEVFGGDGDWRARVRGSLQLDPALDASIASVWKDTRRLAAASREPVDPLSFARMVVVQNFAHLRS